MKINPGLRPLLRQVTALEPDPNNTRKHPEDQVNQIAAWLQQHGQQRPIVVDGDDRVIAGNGVYLAVRQLGWAQVAALTYEGPDARQFSIIDNRSAELSEWDVEALSRELEAFESSDLASLGFQEGDLEQLGIDLEAAAGDLQSAADGLEMGETETTTITEKKRKRDGRKPGELICPRCGRKFTEGQ